MFFRQGIFPSITQNRDKSNIFFISLKLLNYRESTVFIAFAGGVSWMYFSSKGIGYSTLLVEESMFSTWYSVVLSESLVRN